MAEASRAYQHPATELQEDRNSMIRSVLEMGRAALRQEYATGDLRHERAEKIMSEILSGVEKRDSVAVIDAADSDFWDQLAAEITEEREKGSIIEFDLP